MKKFSVSIIIAIFLSAILTPYALANSPDFEWKPGQGLPGVNGTVRAAITWDPDGTGPQPELLVIGGDFTVAGNTLANNIAVWDGNDWHPLGTGMNANPDGYGISALAVYKGQLIAAGYFYIAGDKSALRIARWDGNNWQPLGSGMNHYVYCLTVYNEELIAAGEFTTAGGVSANHIARWNGSIWQALGTGVDGYAVGTLAVYDNKLIVGGFFATAGGASANGIASWDGSTWHSLGNDFNYVTTVKVCDNDLIAGGWFNTIPPDQSEYHQVARWDGNAWQPVGDGFDSDVATLTVYNGELIAGGGFERAGNSVVNGIAKWNGATWLSLENGMHDYFVNVLTVYNSQLIAGGIFSTAGTVTADSVAKWSGSVWQPLGSGNGANSKVHALTVYKDGLIAAGEFTAVGSANSRAIASWNGHSWYSLGTGVDGTADVLAVYNGQLIVAGNFFEAGDVITPNIAIWDGNNWQPFASGVDRQISALTVYNGELIAGGNFSQAGGVDVNNIARWDGNGWKPLGEGTPGWVSALTVYKGNLIAAGQHFIRRWNDNHWQPLGSEMNNNIYTLGTYNGDLIAGGIFTTAGGVSANRIAKWNDSAWQPLSSGVNSQVNTLTVYNSQLIVAGQFTIAGGVTVNRIARWDGSSWHAVGSGMAGDAEFPSVDAMIVYNGELVAGGDFTTADGKVSAYLARWGPVNHSPVARIANEGQTIEAQGPFGAKVTLDGSCSSDADSTPGTSDDINDFDWYRVDPCDQNNKIYIGSGQTIDCNLPLGSHTILLEVADKAGASDSNEIAVTVQDTIPPEFNLSVSPTILWPANHKMIKITPACDVNDLCDPSPKVSLVGITANEPVNPDDIQISDDGSIYLCATRSGNSKARIYTLTYQACDSTGNCTTKTATVTVPHDMRK